MNILISNDDGIDAKGLRELVRHFAKMGDVYVVAPEGQRSSNSHHLTISGRVRYELRDVPCAKKAYALWGTPCDCVHAACRFFFPDMIDLVVSGINDGANISTDIIYSGTIGAAREAHIYRLPAMAVSVASFTAEDFSPAARYAVRIAEEYLKDPDRTRYFLNVNVPAIPYDQIKGISVCDKIGRVKYDDLLEAEEEQGKTYIAIRGVGMSYQTKTEDLDVDINALKNGYVAVSALHNSHISDRFTPGVKDLLKDL